MERSASSSAAASSFAARWAAASLAAALRAFCFFDFFEISFEEPLRWDVSVGSGVDSSDDCSTGAGVGRDLTRDHISRHFTILSITFKGLAYAS